jgi:hypothetical protein
MGSIGREKAIRLAARRDRSRPKTKGRQVSRRGREGKTPRFSPFRARRPDAPDLAISPSIVPEIIWTIGQAIALVRDLEPHLAEVGWHVALAGGVLLRGESAHDLDLVVYPHDSTSVDRSLRTATLRALGWKRKMLPIAVRRHWREKGSRDTKRVEIWSVPEGPYGARGRYRRVDLIEGGP